MTTAAQVFEHCSLAVGEQGLTPSRFDALVRYNERHGCTLFSVGHRRLHFGSFVGVIQVGQLAIEILPKTERAATADKSKWRNALLHMLRRSGLLEVESAPDADLRLRRSPLLDIYLHSFLTEVERLCHAGLVKRYRITEDNLYKLKGRIIFPKQLRQNLLHRERMFTAHQVYDRDNHFNRILKCALTIVQTIASRDSLAPRAAASLLPFENVVDAKITEKTFGRLRFDRNTERYRKALQLARLIILNYAPDLKGGNEHVMAILFDMNKLFERFILVQLRRAVASNPTCGIQIFGQVSKRFWSTKHIRPDILAQFTPDTGLHRVILDTKWKVPHNGQPSDEDL
ncbi:MAG TPA: restriction endonuclease, partial [Candidatus Dormibacteraeota bacterium]|nr:restriction endonuclease [Candidatus Dormibacteraeota bacterium]